MARIETRLQALNILAPVDSTEQAESILWVAAMLKGRAPDCSLKLIGVTHVAPGTSLNEGALLAQSFRGELQKLVHENSSTDGVLGSVASHQPWLDVESLIEESEQDRSLLLLPWHPEKADLQLDLERVLRNPPCDLALVSPAAEARLIRRILLPVRGGPFANLSLQLAVRLARSANAEITLLRVLSSDDDPMSRLLRERFTGLSDVYPEITTELQVVGDAGAAILRELREHQAVILGASAAQDVPPIGLVARLILNRSDMTTLIVKTREPFRMPASPAERTDLPVLLRVEKWFAENTFRCAEFADVDLLVDLKRKQGARISLGLPALNEEATIGNLISAIKGPLMDEAPLVDEIVLIDSNSSDSTRKIAAGLGVPCFVHQEVLPGLGSARGKGEALWKSLYLLKGDLIVWIDTDIANPHPRLVYGIIGPLLMDARVQYVKGFYRRPITASSESNGSEGGRVTELLARPMINMFFPELSGMLQPLAGIYGGRRSALEQVPFYSGHGVEIGLLLDLLGLKAIAQVDLEEVEHRMREPRTMGKMAFSILQVFAEHMRELGLIGPGVSIERTMKILRVEEHELHLEEIDVHEQRRPPMVEVKEYRGRHSPLLI
jgi:nucleotide-binding universal stress UspA family protein